ncbi:MAG: N-acetyl-gamma-glutamyl-phosphate reductase [Cyclobacteriaceae bacterium]|jgi:N-acetyl-gamma-glutamyl-phosphate reductase|nr:N-acetyl-gamma-glutamyl-phosphate reductase [Cyclobacteriaceae bacterium]
MTHPLRAGIVGGAGYTGGETLRLLLQHPQVKIAFVQSRSQAGKPVTQVHSDLVGETDLTFTAAGDAAEVIFLCLGHGESKKLLSETSFGNARLIDLGNDFRLGDSVAGLNFVYGLPEFQRQAIKQARHVANPGCFATAIQVGLLPLAHAGRLGEVHTTGITGSTGAGQKLQDTTHFTWRANNISAYKTLTHQHLGEIGQTLRALQPGFDRPINFVPWRGDFTRGIYVTSVVDFAGSQADANELYRHYYADHPFTHVTDLMIDLKQVVNTNKCLVHLEVVGKKLAIHSALDNLIKGASGQAVQNMNLMFGLDETAGLRLKANAF